MVIPSGDFVNFQFLEIPGCVINRLESTPGGFQGACAVSTLWHDACKKALQALPMAAEWLFPFAWRVSASGRAIQG
jgi:hypothetical protein